MYVGKKRLRVVWGVNANRHIFPSSSFFESIVPQSLWFRLSPHHMVGIHMECAYHKVYGGVEHMDE